MPKRHTPASKTARKQSANPPRAKSALTPEDLIRTTWNLTTEALVLSDADGIVVAANPAYYRLYGLTPEDVLGKKFSINLPKHRRAAAQQDYRAIFQGEDGQTVSETMVICPDGTMRPVETSTDFVEQQGQRVALLSSIRDITLRKQAKHQLHQVRTDLENLVAQHTAAGNGVRHVLQGLSQILVLAQEDERRRVALDLHDEIGQSLAAVGLNLQLLEDLVPDEVAKARVHETLAIVRTAVDQVRQGSFEMRPVFGTATELVATLPAYLQRQAARAKFILHLDLAPDLGPLPVKVQETCWRVIQEALTNIVRHARAENVWVHLQRRRAELELRIRDDGIGFEVAAVAEGSHLGLWGMRERMKPVKGSLEIQSVPGKGTELVALFPLSRRRRAPQKAKHRRSR